VKQVKRCLISKDSVRDKKIKHMDNGRNTYSNREIISGRKRKMPRKPKKYMITKLARNKKEERRSL